MFSLNQVQILQMGIEESAQSLKFLIKTYASIVKASSLNGLIKFN
ncbi:unnamed protein product [Paramecium octaurelia]|uniref:Uncharacterized protein n=1 Tax=Paramecium octaurelia TaxID=43137 RepID=A0A8S1XAM5_PAROT|nr:unnamed protein product [Paramecium octaurelia]